MDSHPTGILIARVCSQGGNMSESTSAGTVSERFNGDPSELSATQAAQLIAPDATIGVSGFGSVGYPKAIPLALADRTTELSLTVVSGGSTGDEIDTELVKRNAIARRFPFQAQPESRKAINNGTIAFHDRHIASLGDEIKYGHLADLDIAIIEAVAVGEDWLIPSTSIGQTPAYVSAADRLLVEVNESQPLGLQRLHDIYSRNKPPDRNPIPLSKPGERIGTSRVNFDPSKLVGVVTSDQPDSPYSFRSPGETEQAISSNLEGFLVNELHRNPIFEEAIHLQFGVGNIGNAMIDVIKSVDFNDRRIHYFGEVFQDGLLDLLDEELLESASATSLALSEEGQDRLFTHLDRYASDIIVRPSAISNNAGLIDQFGVIGINSALSVDVYGHANSTHVGGTHVINGIGGSSDFIRHCPLAIVALPSTTNDGTSRIVPMVKHVDQTEHDVDVIVTEHGVADLRGRTPRERMSLLIEECAHPEVRPKLREYRDRAQENGGHLPHDLETAFDWR